MPLTPPPEAPTKLTPHQPGQPATGWSAGFEWDHADNRKEKERLAGELDFMSGLAATARDLVRVADQLDTVFGAVEANGYVWRHFLPPFPLPGSLAPMRIEDVGAALPISQWLHALLTTEREFTAYVEGVPVAVTVKPIDVIRRLAKAGG